MARKVEAKGGKGGNVWDDGINYDNVIKIQVRGGLGGIQFIKVDYVDKTGKIIDGPIHGVSGRGFTQTFEIDHLKNEYLVSVEGYYDESTGVIQALQFKSNLKTSDMMGYNDGTKFSISYHMRKIVGFHGFAEKKLNSLGAHFVRIPAIKTEIQGNSNSGSAFDHGGNYDGVRKLSVTSDGKAIRHIKFDYDKDGHVESYEHGKFDGTQQEFEIKYPYEYITYVEGTYNLTMPYNCVVLTSLTFKTSKGRTSPTYGNVIGTKFVHESQGNVMIGFHGRSGHCVDGIGVYYVPMPEFPSSPPSPPSEKLLGKGGEGGDSWDDGSFQNVKKIFVGQGDSGIAFVKFEYENETSAVVVGKDHGKKSFLAPEEFDIDYPSEYITSVEGCYDKIFGSETGILTMLRFKTNKRTSPPFGLETASTFVLEKEGHKIVGFHGKASDVVHQIGVHVVPIGQ